MRLRHSGALVGAALLLAACSGGTGSSSAKLETDNQKASYGIGLDMGRNLKPAKDSLDMDALRRGLDDALAGREPALSQDEIQTSLQAFSQAVMAAQQAERTAQGDKNKSEGEAYLAQNGAKEGVTTTDSGLQYEVLQDGDGPTPSADDTVELHYKGTLIDGTVFDSSLDGDPAEFPVSGLIPGFSEALQLMPVGSKYRVVIPSDLAYGSQGAGGDIGPNATLVFEIELLSIK
ncbi:MAG: FKBP-type peptidyl-prolyl cis-trans isomerase [Gemmatimonadota bacterium]|jgi:FKBP-type peptidyl-prolyl cis-trans isomerase